MHPAEAALIVDYYLLLSSYSAHSARSTLQDVVMPSKISSRHFNTDP
jgi:hypothetical protein